MYSFFFFLSLMFKSFFNKIISCLVLFAFIYLMFDLITGSPLSFDSLEDYSNFFVQDSNNSGQVNEQEDTHKIPLGVVSFYDKIRRKLHWEIYGHNNHATVEEFNKSWKPSVSLRSLFKSEFNKIKKSPVDYLKKDYSKTREVIREKNRVMHQLERNDYYVEGKGWLTRKDLHTLNAKGLTVKYSKIVKISK